MATKTIEFDKESLEILWNFPSESAKARIFQQYFSNFNQTSESLKFKSRDIIWRHRIIEDIPIKRLTNFNHNGNYFSFGYRNALKIWDLSENKLHFERKLKSIELYNDVKFMCSDNENLNGLDIVTATCDVKHERILPVGDMVSLEQQKLNEQCIELAPSPHSSHEVLCNSKLHRIYNIDFRYSSENLRPVIVLEAGNSRLKSLKHHPLAPMICFGTELNTVRIYDKRNFSKPLQNLKALPLSNRRSNIKYCFYNFDGSEIVAFYSNHLVGFFKNYHGGDVQVNYFDTDSPNLSMNLFGPKSEFIIRCHHSGSKYMLDRATGLEYHIRSYTPRTLKFNAHPTLPILVETNEDGISILAP